MAQASDSDRVNRRRFMGGVFRGALACTYVAAFGWPRGTASEATSYLHEQLALCTKGYEGPDFMEVSPRLLALIKKKIEEIEADRHIQLAEEIFGVGSHG